MATVAELHEDITRSEENLPCILDGKFFTFLPGESTMNKRVAHNVQRDDQKKLKFVDLVMRLLILLHI